jgi:hypothetical protein
MYDKTLVHRLSLEQPSSERPAPSPEVPSLQICGLTTLRNKQWHASMKCFSCSYWFTLVVFYPFNLQTWDYRTHDQAQNDLAEKATKPGI